MQISAARLFALVAFDIVIFGIAAFVLLQFMPKPLKAMDYLMVGGVATLISLASVWLLVLREMPNKENLLYTKRTRKLDQD